MVVYEDITKKVLWNKNCQNLSIDLTTLIGSETIDYDSMSCLKCLIVWKVLNKLARICKKITGARKYNNVM